MSLNFISNVSDFDRKNKTLVFIHGNSMTSETFKYQIYSDYLKKYQCIAFDLPGHGRSNKLNSYSLNNLVNSVSEEISGFENIYLVGHSLGGQVALHLTPVLNDRCKGIILVATPPSQINADLDKIYNINEVSLLLLAGKLNKEEIHSLSNFLYPFENEWSQKLKESILNTDHNFRIGYTTSINDPDLPEEAMILEKFKGDKLMIVGKNDPLLLLDYLEKVSKKINVPLKIIENCSHFPQIEKAETINQLIFEFIQDKQK